VAAPESREIRDYTRGFRFPQVVGKLGHWRPFWGIATIPQYVVAVVSAVALVRWWRLWAHFPPAVNVLLAGAVPAALFALAGRRTQLDGRPPTSTALTLLAYGLGVLASGSRGSTRRTRVSGWVWMLPTRHSVWESGP
jgi:hypothetical protein